MVKYLSISWKIIYGCWTNVSRRVPGRNDIPVAGKNRVRSRWSSSRTFHLRNATHQRAMRRELPRMRTTGARAI